MRTEQLERKIRKQLKKWKKKSLAQALVIRKCLKAGKSAIGRFRAALSENKLAALHTLMLSWLIIRVEQVHTLLNNTLIAVIIFGHEIAAQLLNAKEQFGAAIQSILSLFGGDNAA